MSYPKVVALDTDWTVWKEFLNHDTWGKGHGALMPVEDNIERPDNDPMLLRDRSDHAKFIRVFDDISKVVNDILKNGAKLAIVSRNPSKAMCDRALYYFNTINPSDNQEWSIIHLVQYDEVVDESKVQHFRRIRGWSQSDFSEMVLFDDEAFNNVVRIELGITFQFVRDNQGLTWEAYQHGLHAWRRARNMILSGPSAGRRVFIGYSGLSPFWINLVRNGEGIVDPKVPYRWGYALYVADMFGIAKFFRDWDERDWGNHSEVCEVWVKDYDAWAAINKIWVPENGGVIQQTNNMNWTPEESAKNQENRDRSIAQLWDVKTPYILFSRHHPMADMPDCSRPRSNEMVVYTQIQRSLFELVKLDRSAWNTIRPEYGPYPFHKQIGAWNIKLPSETIRELGEQGDRTDLFE